MAPAKKDDYWTKFWRYYKEAASCAAFTMPDPTKAGDWMKLGVEAVMALVAAAEVSKQTGVLSVQRIMYHMAARGQYKYIEALSRIFGWVVRVNKAGSVVTRGLLSSGAVGTAGTASTGTVALSGEISVTIPGLATTAVGAAVAAYVGTIIGCLGYAQLRMMKIIDPDNGYLAKMYAQFYGYDPQTEAATDYLYAQAKARSGAVRQAARLGATIPKNLLQAY